MLSTAIPGVEPIQVPLQWVDVSKPADRAAGKAPQYKLGIYVGLGDAAPKVYEFDTGGEGFWSAYNPNLPKQEQWWGDFSVVKNRNMSIIYSSGNQYLANQVRSSVQLYSPPDAKHGSSLVIGTGQDVDLGQIVKYSDKKASDVKNWNNALKKGDPPLGGVFYGDFGASLSPIGKKGKGILYSILPQISLPEGLIPGFLVHAGKPGDAEGPYLQLGLTQANIDSADTTLPMTLYSGNLGKAFPVTGLPTYSQQVTTADFAWKGKGGQQKFQNVGWTIDTGALLVNVWQGDRLAVRRQFLGSTKMSGGFRTGKFLANQSFSVFAQPINPGGANFKLDIKPTGSTPTFNLVAAAYHDTGTMGRNYVNTGLLTFEQYDILYNLQGGTIHFAKLDGGN